MDVPPGVACLDTRYPRRLPTFGQVSRAFLFMTDPQLVDLAQPSGLNLVDESAHALLVRDERARLDASDRLAHVLLQVGEGLHGEVGLHTHLLVDLSFELVV